jgi:hypothetical protein
LESETDHQIHVEEANQFINFWRFFKLFDLYSISSSVKFSRDSKKSFSTINERKQANEVLGCDKQAFEYHSNVDKPCATTNTEVKSKQLNVRQSHVIESTNLLVDSITCLGSYNSFKQAEEWKVSPINDSLINSSPDYYRSFEDVSYHFNTNGS